MIICPSISDYSFCGDFSRSGNDVVIGIVTDLSSIESKRSVRNYTICPGGNRYHIPSFVVDNGVPYTNQIFESVDQGYRFYKAYARLGGFSVHKTTENIDDAGTVLLKHYVCSCEGFNNPKDNPKVLKKRRFVTRRCGCKEKMVLKYMAPNKYFVYCSVGHHNHPLTCKKGRYFLHSSREMITSLRNIYHNGAKINIGVIKSFSFAKEMYGGYANIGTLLQDFRNFNRDLKLFIGDKDAQMMIEKFKRMQEKSKGFYFAYDVDSEGHLTKSFIIRYNLIFAPFTGVEKHDRCVTFASCLLAHESAADYSWAFGHLVKAMELNLILIITNQCPSMKVSICDVFSDVNGLVRSKNHLCMWHIMENFSVKLGNRLYKETDFM
ncbi:protein FAR1-RELATED SEQUENCE 5-like [Apium graveolens]|uniref:protein FAR1-RELATED SEQUENCE 5-like n=1 Tax=Apium graveolens TaxID=4045 RepID=UPI003D79DC90